MRLAGLFGKILKMTAKTSIVVTMLDDRSYMRTDSRPRWSMTTVLLITLVVCFIVQLFLERAFPTFRNNFGLSLEGLKQRKVWELITFQFMHAGPMHLLGNALGVFFFGRAIEDAYGGREMIKLYLLAGTFGGLLQVGLEAVFHGYFSAIVVGASAGVFGLIAAFATRAPDMPITMLVLFILPVTFPAKVLLLIEGIIALLGILPTGFMLGIAHGAHLGGMLTGILFVKWMQRPRAMVVWKPERRKPQLVGNAPKRAAWRKPRRKVEEVTPGEYISREVDPILEKISAHGIHSLTEQERKILEAARDKMAKR
jgi:membrane associated rhomboid family serine protease